MNDFVILAAGVLCAGFGGEFFVRGLVGLANWARVSSGIIGITIAAFATSSPELSVAISAALAGKPEIAMGDALGSNIVNIGLILAIALLISRIKSSRDNIKRDFPLALIIPLFTGLLAIDGVLSLIDGMLLITLFIIWIVIAITNARKQRNKEIEVRGEYKKSHVIIYSLIGMLFLVAAGQLIVVGAKGIALSFALDEFIIGATIVAIGTSAPELATVIVAKLRGHDELGIGTILGSNIFNGLWIIGVAAIINPISIHAVHLAIVLVFGIIMVIVILPTRQGEIQRRRGLILLILYVSYLVIIIL